MWARQHQTIIFIRSVAFGLLGGCRLISHRFWMINYYLNIDNDRFNICDLVQLADTKKVHGRNVTRKARWPGATSWSQAAILPANKSGRLRRSAKTNRSRARLRKVRKVIVSYHFFLFFLQIIFISWLTFECEAF